MYAASSGDPVNLTHMAVGDGGGNEVTPDEAQTSLVREVYRTTVNRVYRPDVVNYPSLFAAELVIPASEGGFTMREVGIFDADGTLFAVGNLPATYKPEASEGAFSDTVVRLEFIATNSDVVSIVFDPDVAVVTQNWISNNVTAGALIPGGTTGQVLAKQSNEDGDVIWKDPTEANVVVNTIEEVQTLAALQTVVTFSTVMNVGLAVYINGARLPNDASADGWQGDALDATKITLGQSYPDGSQMIAVQNEPASDLPDSLRKDLNLSDVPDKATARTNLGVPSVSEMTQRTPPGAVIYFARETAPTGWLKANGAEVSRTVYADLFDAIGTLFGSGNGSTTFTLPDLRGEFLRGWDNGRGVDSGRTFGSSQSDELKSHGHRILGGTGGQDTNSPSSRNNIAGMDRQNTYVEGSPVLIEKSGGTETRPRNIALLACIKY
jgi:phage-related tail fiber protein